MVWINPTSALSSTPSPTAFYWDSSVRKHHAKYQRLIDGLSYQLQRTQRLFLKLSYPRKYFGDVKELQLMKKKQDVGEVTQTEADLYKNIDPNIAESFNRTFSGRFPFPKVGLLLGASSLVFTTWFNFSIPARLVTFCLPVMIDLINWVIRYRQAKCFAERNLARFNSEETKKVLGKNNLVDLGEQLVALAQLNS